MEPGDALSTAAQIAVALAGFAGVDKRPTTNFWLLHAAFGLGSGLCVLFKLVFQRQLQVEQT
jgi:cyanate permease